MRAKILLRSIGAVLLIVAVGVTAYGFMSDNKEDNTNKVATNATEEPGTDIALATDLPATEEVPQTTATAQTTEEITTATETPQTGSEGTEDNGVGTETTAQPEVTVTPTTTPEITPEPAIKEYTLVVNKGMSATQIANALEQNGIIRDAKEFTQVLVSRGVTEDINVGSYVFTSDNTYDQIINALTGKQK